MRIAIPLLSLLITGLLVGDELAVALFIHPILYGVRDDAHARVVKPLARRLGRSMPFWYAVSLVFAIFQWVTSSQTISSYLCGAAVALMALIIVLTLIFPVPINNRIAALDLDRLPPDWLEMRRRWDLYHQVRVVLLIVVLTLLILAALVG